MHESQRLYRGAARICNFNAFSNLPESCNKFLTFRWDQLCFSADASLKTMHRKYTPELHRKAPDRKYVCSNGILQGGGKPLTTEVPNFHHIYQYIYHDFHLNIHSQNQNRGFKECSNFWPKNICPKCGAPHFSKQHFSSRGLKCYFEKCRLNTHLILSRQLS